MAPKSVPIPQPLYKATPRAHAVLVEHPGNVLPGVGSILFNLPCNFLEGVQHVTECIALVLSLVTLYETSELQNATYVANDIHYTPKEACLHFLFRPLQM
jgi:hypothetical protein